MLSREEALTLDRDDPLRAFRDEFEFPEANLNYLDGNSLGRLPKRGRAALERAVGDEWGRGLVRSWHDWIGLPQRIGDSLAPLIGASPGEVTLGDQTSINLFKLAWAGMRASGRTVVVGDDSNFPSDRYVLRAVANELGGEYREMQVDPIEGPTVADLERVLDDDVGVVGMSMVAFKSGALADAMAITERVRRAGALMLWDLSHAAGAVPVELNGCKADLAIGCTYKYLNGGPGSPAFLYVRKDLQTKLQQPIPGWFGHDAMFAFEGGYRPADDVRRFTVGTPPILSLRGAEAGIEVMAEAGMDRVRAKSIALTDAFIARADARLDGMGFRVATPRDAAHRGSHVSLAHREGFGLTQALIARGVVPDFRAPDSIRFGFTPLYTRFVDVWDAIEVLGEIYEKREHEGFGAPSDHAVT